MESTTEPFTGLLGGLLIGMSYADFAIPIGVALWSILLLFSMANVDCSSPIAASVFVAYLLFSGMILVIIIPERWLSTLSFGTYLKWSIILVTVAYLKWIREYMQQKKRIEILKAKKKEELSNGAK